MNEGANRRARALAQGMTIAGMGVSLGAGVVAAIWGGNWIDAKLGTSPLFLLILLVGALYGWLRRLLWVLKQNSKAS
jgi:F0F1-type ATP synthase assembly protein I